MDPQVVAPVPTIPRPVTEMQELIALRERWQALLDWHNKRSSQYSLGFADAVDTCIGDLDDLIDASKEKSAAGVQTND